MPERERGTALVEFALVLPLLTIFVLGAVDLGRAYRLKTELANAAREGGAYAQYFPSRVSNTGTACTDPSNIGFIARNERGASTSFTVGVTRASDGSAITGCEQTTVAPGNDVVVRASAPFAVLTPLVRLLTGSTLTLRSDVRVVVQG